MFSLREITVYQSPKMLLLFAIVCWSMLSAESQTVSINRRMIPDRPMEGDYLVLKCTVSNPLAEQYVEWLEDEDPVTNGSDVLRDRSVYLLQSERVPETGNLIYQLNITSASRMDFGRWTCRARAENGRFISENVVVNVQYRPDPMYPVCEVVGESLTCQTQEGNPRVVVDWFLNTDANRTQFRRSREMTEGGYILSELYVSKIGEPMSEDETVVCESAASSCSISKALVYNRTSVLLTKELQDGQIQIRCNTTIPLPGGRVDLEFDTQADGLVKYRKWSDELDKSATYKLSNVSSPQDKFSCKLHWGPFNHLESTISLTEKDSNDGDNNSTDGGDRPTSTESFSRTWIIAVLIAVGLIVMLVVILIIVSICLKRKDENPV